MSKFFIYEERLDLQKYLKEGLSFKQFAHRMGNDTSKIVTLPSIKVILTSILDK